MESLKDMKERLSKQREERRTRLLELKAIVDNAVELPPPENMDRCVRDRYKEYRQSQERLQWTEMWWERARSRKMEALRPGNNKEPGKVLSAIKESRRAEKKRDERRLDAISSAYRVDGAVSERNMRDVIVWQQAMAPMRIDELEKEIKGLDATIRDVERIINRPKNDRLIHDTGPNKNAPDIVDLSCLDDDTISDDEM